MLSDLSQGSLLQEGQRRRQDSTLGLTQACGCGVPVLVPRLSQPQAALGRCSVEAPAALLDTEM